MATMRDIVERALKEIGVVAIDEPVTAADMSDGMTRLNSMMHGLKLFGIDLEFTTKAASDDFPLDPEFEEGAVYLLAERMAPSYTAPAGTYDMWFRALQAAYMVIPTTQMPLGLLRTSSQRRYTTDG